MENNGMSIIGLVQNLAREFPCEAKLCVVDVGASMRSNLIEESESAARAAQEALESDS